MPEDNREAVLVALAAEHAAMQSVIGSSVSEQQARASMFLLSVSGGLVVIGLVAQTDRFLLFAATIVSALYLTGLLTIMRLIDVAMESMQSEVTIAKIRRYYRTLGAPADILFEEQLGRWPEGKLDSGHVTGRVLGVLTTAASMIACVNAFIGGAGVALLLYHAFAIGFGASVLAGGLFLVAQVALAAIYQLRRITMIEQVAKGRAFLKDE